MWNYGALLIAYFLGAIPFAYLVGRMKNIDIRTQGSGNVGATNTWRLLGAKYGALVLLGDTLKGVLATALCLYLVGPWGAVGGGILAILGHMRNPFLGFKSTGKGVATGFGVIIVLIPTISFIAAAIFVVVVLVTRYVSLGSTIGVLSVVAQTIFTPLPLPYKIFIFSASALILFRHRANYQRLLNGTESRLKLWK